LGVVAKRIGRVLVVHLDGELDLHTAEPFKEAVAEALAQDRSLRHLVVTMNRVTFMDSSGVGALLGRYREIAERGGRLALVGLQLPVKRVFELSGMSGIISVYDSEGQALASF